MADPGCQCEVSLETDRVVVTCPSAEVLARLVRAALSGRFVVRCPEPAEAAPQREAQGDAFERTVGGSPPPAAQDGEPS